MLRSNQSALHEGLLSLEITMDHVFDKHINCDQTHCHICDGGLSRCTVCFGAEGSLPSECPGTPMTEVQQTGVMNGEMDFFKGRWKGTPYGQLALEWCKVRLPIRVLHSNAGFYIGTFGEDGPCSRESAEYWPDMKQAVDALRNDNWTQRDHP